jgi:hypothetical protein
VASARGRRQGGGRTALAAGNGRLVAFAEQRALLSDSPASKVHLILIPGFWLDASSCNEVARPLSRLSPEGLHVDVSDNPWVHPGAALDEQRSAPD